jgi:hypothetical protein
MATKNKPMADLISEITTKTIYQLLQEAAPTTVNVKLTSGDLITGATVVAIASNGIQVLDNTANLVRFIPEWATAYISIAP